MSERTRLDARYGRRGGHLQEGTSTVLDKLPRCEECGGPIVASRSRRRHGFCNDEILDGKVCSCPPGCTDRVWGDQGRCDPDCDPCRIMAGRPHVATESKAPA